MAVALPVALEVPVALVVALLRALGDSVGRGVRRALELGVAPRLREGLPERERLPVADLVEVRLEEGVRWALREWVENRVPERVTRGETEGGGLQYPWVA